MGKPELGSKLNCVNCAVRFYDLLRVPAVCPKCDAVQPPPKPRAAFVTRGAPRRWMSPAASPAAAGQADDEAAVAVEVDDDLDAVDPPEIDDDDDDDDTDVVKPEIGVDG
ncbi:MAG: FYDLN acid domain-containing protein [Alphaproteobacteria bacterium]|nr:FYDLN acid domain-containing protein [Alphaproteobacteria bacterium]